MIQSAGAPLHLEYKHRLNETLPGRFYELYGLTEGLMTVLDRGDAVRKAGSVGAPIGFYEMRILDDAGHDVPPGTAGEICGRGPLMMAGYYERPDLTAKAVGGRLAALGRPRLRGRRGLSLSISSTARRT